MPNTIAFTARGLPYVSDGGGNGHSHIDESQIWLVHFRVGVERTPQYEQ